MTGADITTAGQQDYYSLTIPSGTSGTMQVTMQSSGLSLLEPKLSIYNASGVLVGIGHRLDLRRHDHGDLLGGDGRADLLCRARAARSRRPTARGPTPSR